MTNRTDEALRRTMTAIIDSAPEAPDMPVAPATVARTGAWAPRLAAASAFALVLVVGIGIALTSRGQVDDSRDVMSQATTYESIAADLGASPMPDVEIRRISGGEIAIPGSGYGINRISVEGLDATVGLAMYQDRSLEGETVYTCFTHYAVIDGVSVAGGGRCAPTLEQAAEIARFDIAIEGSCGPRPKDDPQIDGRWTLVSVWGIPDGVDVVDIELGSGAVEAVEVSDAGVAQMLWEDPDDIISIRFAGMTAEHSDRILQYNLPAPAINCAPDDGPG
ncbi:MAG: hypothetical protein U9N79_08845 [Actinomycetota bacterium]|nr:hypothetical protein [Actinomycetota bacterium]